MKKANCLQLILYQLQLKHKNHEEESKHKTDSEGVFAKPATPPPISPKENTDEKNDTITENSETITEDEEDSNSEFEKIEPEN